MCERSDYPPYVDNSRPSQEDEREAAEGYVRRMAELKAMEAELNKPVERLDQGHLAPEPKRKGAHL